jgi:hypothetical protein
MTRVRKPRVTSKLSEPLYRKLDMYGLAAAAAGMSLAALSSPAQAEIVYTPAHKEIGRNGVGIDFNHDGLADIEFAAGLNFFADGGGMVVYSHQSNRGFGTSRGEFVSMLPLGYTVGPNSAKFKLGIASSNYPKPKKFFYYCEANSGGASCAGPWYQPNGMGTSGSYVGVKFLIDGQVHYGWARIKLVVTGEENHYHFSAYLTGYAYETVANKPIVTGKTSGSIESVAKEPEVLGNATRPSATLGMLSAGSSALPLWRLSLQ